MCTEKRFFEIHFYDRSEELKSITFFAISFERIETWRITLVFVYKSSLHLIPISAFFVNLILILYLFILNLHIIMQKLIVDSQISMLRVLKELICVFRKHF